MTRRQTGPDGPSSPAAPAGKDRLLVRLREARRSRDRAALLQRATTAIAASQTEEDIHRVAAAALDELSVSEGIRLTLLVGTPEHLRDIRSSGADDLEEAGGVHVFSIETIPLRAGDPVRYPIPEGDPAFEKGCRHGLAVPVMGSQMRGVIVAAGRRPPSHGFAAALSAMAAGMGVALERATFEHRLSGLLQRSSDLVTVVAIDGAISYQSPAAGWVLGHEPQAFDHKNLTDLIHPDDQHGALAKINRVIEGPTGETQFQARWRHADGTWRHTETVVTNHMNDPAVGGLVLNTRDVTEMKTLEVELTHRALHDPLTDLANRALFKESVERALRRTGRNGRSVAVVFLDIDDFKHVNDSLGHEAGDRLLAAVAERIRVCVRPYDVAARLGGDEFAILLENADLRVAASVAERILREMDEPIQVSGREIATQGSLGIAIGGPGDDTENVMRNADVAMYTAKAKGKGRYEVFEPGMNSSAVERMELAADLRKAVEGKQFILHYQPIVGLADGRILGVEALIRWKHPERGMVGPVEFVPVAEETGLIVPIGRWVLNEACRQLRQWQDRHGDPPLTMSVNVSVKQLQDPRFVNDVRTALATTGLDPMSLTLEITETVLMSDTEEVLARLEELRAVGVRLAIDDFGTGYASLGYLARFPLNVLKVDRSFITEAGTSQESSLTPVMVSIGRSLGLQTVAEGVENAEQVAHLRNLGFDAAQGFLFSRPAAGDEIDTLLSVRRLVKDFTSYDQVGI
jgi:diguanylate cyclase (GGDEF)-like protein/PAS domain S-box-containing protein